jgi:hypothetical protein
VEAGIASGLGDDRFARVYGPTSGSVSFVTHVILILLLALVTSQGAKVDPALTNLVSTPAEDPRPEELVEIPNQPDAPRLEAVVDKEQPVDLPDDKQVLPAINPDGLDDPAPAIQPIDPLGSATALPGEYMILPGAGISPYGRRDPKVRRSIPDVTEVNEKAVAAALKWLAEHQLPDGSWSFDHRGGACQGRCRNQGNLADARIGSTGLALLPFLGAGQTHQEGSYKNVVKKGLAFLLTKMKVQGGQTGDLMEPGGNLYSHGIASIVLCEAYALTHDKGLVQPAQLSLNHIVAAQDPVGGGWRYQMKQAGDTSVVGWQLMALKSGHMAYLNVPPATIKLASNFLDSVQAESGSQYGYTGPATGRDATTAIGLLCRMYLGWKKDHPALAAGVKYLGDRGPSQGNFYYNYYATQVLHHYSGDPWKKWNAVMSEQLVTSQGKEGHEAGSWFVGGGDHGADAGGRLYCTAMATMILEVYYRHLPIYGRQASQDDFKL